MLASKCSHRKLHAWGYYDLLIPAATWRQPGLIIQLAVYLLANSQQSFSECLEGCKLWKSQAPWIRDVGILLFVLVFILSTMNKIKDPILVGQVDSWPMAFVSTDVGRNRMRKRWEKWNKSYASQSQNWKSESQPFGLHLVSVNLAWSIVWQDFKGTVWHSGCSQCHWDSNGQTEAFAEVKIVESFGLPHLVWWGPRLDGQKRALGASCVKKIKDYSNLEIENQWAAFIAENWGALHSWPSGQSLTWSRAVFATSQAWWSYQETNWTQV